jgi:hypothetical protein
VSAPDIHWIQPDLALGGLGTEVASAAVARACGIGALVDLRGEWVPDADASAAGGIRLLHLPTPDRTGPSQADLDCGVAFVETCAAEGRRVLIHCQHGIGRSAVLALCVLGGRGIAPLAGLALAKETRAAVSPSRAQFDAWCLWLARRTPFAAPSWYEFGVIAYRPAP